MSRATFEYFRSHAVVGLEGAKVIPQADVWQRKRLLVDPNHGQTDCPEFDLLW